MKLIGFKLIFFKQIITRVSMRGTLMTLKAASINTKDNPLWLVSFVIEVFVMMDTDLGVCRVYLIIDYSYIITVYTTCIISIRCVVK